MLRLLTLALAAITLAACDTPDPSTFPKHALRDSAGTGSHIAGVGQELDGSSTSDTHSIERMQNGGNGKDKNIAS